MRSLLQRTGFTALSIALVACGGNANGVPSAASGANANAGNRIAGYAYSDNVVRACPTDNDKPDVAECLALMRTDVGGAHPNVAGLGPSDLQGAYKLPSSTAGKGEIVAVVDAYDDPAAANDVNTYRSYFGIPTCNATNPCFIKVNQKGQQKNYPVASASWAVEESLDVDMVSAICPNCTVVLVEANTNSLSDLGKSVGTAVKIMHANAVSNSYIAYKAKYSIGGDYFHHPGHIITAAGGDDGYMVGEPAGFPDVVAVGGTDLIKASGKRHWNEIVWPGTGSGCVLTRPKPTWQHDKGCKWRTMNDVAADASPSSGVAVYDSYLGGGWIVVGGTSAASPIIASVYALAGNTSKLNAAESLYAQGASLYDVTQGADGVCPSHHELCYAGKGYDGPTGNGTPNGVSAF